MATSGSIDFNPDRNTIIERALRLANVTEAGETPVAEELSAAAAALNSMVKAWQGEGYRLWKKAEFALFLVKGTANYELGSGGDRAVLAHVKTELSVAGSASDTTITVDSITGFSPNDDVGGTGIKTIGIVQDDDTVFWTTVSGTPSGSTITLTTGLDSAAAVDNHVYGYANAALIDRPLRVMEVRRRNSDNSDIPIITFSRKEYFDTPNKTTQSLPTQVYYDPQLSLGQLYMWPTPSNSSDRLMCTGAFPLEDFDASTDTADLPQEGISALEWNLALELGVEFAIPNDLYTRIERIAGRTKETFLNWDVEPESIYFGPDLTMGGG